MVSAYLAVACALLFLGCSKSSEGAPQFSANGQHPANWSEQHWVEFTKNPDQCVVCHGSYKDKATSGGIAKVSCFSCHAHPNGPLHPTGWSAPAAHGIKGAMAAPGLGTGLAHCQVCHGDNYQDPSGYTLSCLACHSKAPHPDKPWHGTTASGTNHAATDPGNAAACVQCHANGANSTLVLHGTAPVGTAPGCYNNTMCHGNNPGHVVGWSLADQHGRKFAQAAPGATSGFAYCSTCHGSTYSNGVATACTACHKKAPHPDKPWNGAAALSVRHSATDSGNAPECLKCHANGANSSLKPRTPAPAGTAPGCYNNTMCHGTTINP